MDWVVASIVLVSIYIRASLYVEPYQTPSNPTESYCPLLCPQPLSSHPELAINKCRKTGHMPQVHFDESHSHTDSDESMDSDYHSPEDSSYFQTVTQQPDGSLQRDDNDEESVYGLLFSQDRYSVQHSDPEFQLRQVGDIWARRAEWLLESNAPYRFEFGRLRCNPNVWCRRSRRPAGYRFSLRLTGDERGYMILDAKSLINQPPLTIPLHLLIERRFNLAAWYDDKTSPHLEPTLDGDISRHRQSFHGTMGRILPEAAAWFINEHWDRLRPCSYRWSDRPETHARVRAHARVWFADVAVTDRWTGKTYYLEMWRLYNANFDVVEWFNDSLLSIPEVIQD